MNNRIDNLFERCKRHPRKILSPYITAGDPQACVTVDLMHALVDAGADIIELGIPFSDPMAEGPVIQAAMERALKYGINCDDVLEMVRKFRKNDDKTPIVLMGYCNPIENMGYERFAQSAQQSGVDGTIIVDLPPEESETVRPLWQQYGLHSIYLCSPTTTDERMAVINRLASGYVYYVSLKGVTGADSLAVEQVKQSYCRRKAQVDLPLLVGFGIKTPAMAAAIAEFADGVVVGAAIIERIEQLNQEPEEIPSVVSELLAEMRQAMDERFV